MRKGIKSSYEYRWSDKYRQLKLDALKQLEDDGEEVPQVLKDWYNNPDAYDEYEDEDEYIKERYEFVDFKYIQDEDGFSNTYYMYYDNFEDRYVFVFDEDDLFYEYFDWEEENEEAAREWFSCYGNDECDIYSSTKINASQNNQEYNTKLIARYVKDWENEIGCKGMLGSDRNINTEARMYMQRNRLAYNSNHHTIDVRGNGEWITIFKVIPNYNSTKRNGCYTQKLPTLVPIEDIESDANEITSSTKINASTSSHVFVVIKTGMNPKVIGVYGNRESAETEVRSHKDGNYNIMPFAIQ